MAKSQKRSLDQGKIEELARRRAGARYINGSFAVQDRLRRLKEEYEKVPASYRGYLAVGICSCLESHIKYCYAAAAEMFYQHPDLLRALFKDVNVDIDTLISTTSKTFALADVVAASITVSTLTQYRARASQFFSAFDEKPHDFPWDFLKIMTAEDRDQEKEYSQKLARLSRVFDARHRFVHETSILQDTEPTDEDDLLKCVDDALVLISQFHRQLDDIGMRPQYAVVKVDEGLVTAFDRNVQEINDAFERIRLVCDERQYEKLDEFKDAFFKYLYARCDFQASVFISQRSEASMSDFLYLAPEYRKTLKELALAQKYALSQYPVAKQYADMGLEPDGSLTPEWEILEHD